MTCTRSRLVQGTLINYSVEFPENAHVLVRQEVKARKILGRCSARRYKMGVVTAESHPVSMAEPPFPEAPRVIYERNPLIQVICQLRFPPILKVQTTTPADFQDRIRHLYPEFQHDRQPALTTMLPPELLQQMQLSVPESTGQFRFLTEDASSWSVTLSTDFLSVATVAYPRWERFCEHAQPAIEALEEIYRPGFYRRIGLRYRDRISRREVGLSGCGWSELFQPFVLAHLSEGAMANQIVEEFGSKVRFRWSNNEAALMQCGLEQVDDETCFTIDFDFYCDKRTETGQASQVLDRFNRLAGRAFRWCIKDRLHEALGPQPVEDQ